MAESESKSSSDLPDFIPANLIQREPFFDRRSDTQSPISPVREGLPPTYRMRADAHYVDQLTRPSSSVAVHLLKIDELESSDEAADPLPAVACGRGSAERCGGVELVRSVGNRPCFARRADDHDDADSGETGVRSCGASDGNGSPAARHDARLED